MLRVTDLSFRYGRRPVLDAVNLVAPKGRVLGLLGPNGTGKTTLLRCMLHVAVPARGSVWLDDEDVGRMSPRRRARHMAYVPQAHPARFPMSVFDMVLAGRKPFLKWRPSDGDIRRVTDALAMMGLAPLAAETFDALSGGQKQKVMLARAFVQEADYLLLDEPTSNLDLKHQVEVLALVRRSVREKRIGAVVAIHDLNMALRFADDVVLLHNGGVFGSGVPEKVLTAAAIEAVFGVCVEDMRGRDGRRCWYPVGPAATVDETGGAQSPVVLRAAGAL